MVSSKCCQVVSPSPFRFFAALILPCAHTECDRFTGTMEKRSTVPPFSAILITAASPASPPPTTMILGFTAIICVLAARSGARAWCEVGRRFHQPARGGEQRRSAGSSSRRPSLRRRIGHRRAETFAALVHRRLSPTSRRRARCRRQGAMKRRLIRERRMVHPTRCQAVPLGLFRTTPRDAHGDRFPQSANATYASRCTRRR